MINSLEQRFCLLISGRFDFSQVTAAVLPVLQNEINRRIVLFLLFADFILSLLHFQSHTEYMV